MKYTTIAEILQYCFAKIKTEDPKAAPASRLAEQAGVARSTVGEWLKGARPKMQFLPAIAEFCGVTVNELIRLSEYPEIMLADSASLCYDVGNQSVPVIGRVVAGVVQLLYDWTEIGQPPAAAEECVTVPITEAKSTAYALSVTDDSMERTISRGSRIIVDPTAEFVSGLIYIVFANDNHIWLKRVTKQGTLYLLTSDNPLYPPIHLVKSKIIRMHLVEWIRAH